MNHFNWVIGTADTRDKIKYHLNKFARMFAVVRAAAQLARRFKGTIAFELLSTSLYWKTPLLREFIHDNNLRIVDFHGCCFNLRVVHGPNAGMLALKPWRVATNSRYIYDALNKQCSGDHQHQSLHGSNLAESERYTPEIANVIHKAYKQQGSSKAGRFS
jgi:hypothetical protein